MVPPASNCRALKKGWLEERLRHVGNDCEERARRSRNADARNLYHLAAREAGRIMPASEMACQLQAAEALRNAGLWYDGEPVFSGEGALPEPPAPEPGPIEREPIAGLLNARQLASLCGRSERGARAAIERGLRRNLAGFYRFGALLFAEPEAFRNVLR